jgi:uncharacterized membrane protein YhhN
MQQGDGKMQFPWLYLIGYLIVLSGLMAVVCVPERKKKYYIFAKGIASAAFLFVLCMAPNGVYGLLPAFCLCFAGDLLMAFYNRKRKKRHFLGGLFAFLTGHICFIGYLATMQPITAPEFMLPIAVVLCVFYLTRGHKIHTGRLRPFILLYAFFVAFFLSKAWHILALGMSGQTIFVALGGTLFAVSDFSILFLYFSKQKGTWLHIFNLLTYYMGMFFLAASLYTKNFP